MIKNSQKRTIIITSEGFEDEEVIYPTIRLKEAGFNVDIATKDKKLVLGRRNFPLERLVKYYANHVDTVGLTSKKYELVLIPGGFEAPDRLRRIPEVLNFIKEMYENNKIVAAICHGPWVLISAGILKGKKVTCYPSIIDDIKNSGAKFIDQPAVTDGNIITARHPGDMGDLIKAILTKF